MKTQARSLKPSLLVCALYGLAVNAVHAQSLESVVISASRAEQNSFDAPASVDAVDRETIQSAGPQVNLSESLNRVPGLTILNRQNYAQDLQLSIRGFGSRASFGIRGIRLLIDGIPATTPDGQGQGSSIALTSTDRIEVLRGPLAQIYGNASGGVIQAWTRDAPETPEASFQYHRGSYGLEREVLQLGGRAGSVGIIADYSMFSTDGFRSNSRTERQQFNSKISLSPSESTKINIIVNHFNMPLAEDPLGLTAAQLAANPRGAGTNASEQRVRKITSQSQLGASLTHAIDSQTSVTTRLYAGERDNLQYQANARWVGLDRSYHGLGFQYNGQTEAGGLPLKWVAGFDYDASSELRQGGLAVNGERTSVTRNEDNISSNQDVFVQGTAVVSDALSVVAGLRYSSVRFSSEDYYFIDGADGSGKVKYSALNPVLGITWHASDDLNLYANIGKGFETPTLAEVAYRDSGSAVLSQFNTALDKSTSRHFEVGSKWKPSPSSRVDLAAFRIETSDEIVVSRSASGQTAFKNAPSTTRTGLELSNRVLLSDQWRSTISATALQAKFSESFDQIQSGNSLPGVPQQFLFAELLWGERGFSNPGEAKGWQAGVELVHSGKLYATDTNAAKVSGSTVVNLKTSKDWKLGRGLLTAYGRIDNVGDKQYVGSVIVNQSAGQFYEPAPGRNWTAGLRLQVPF